ncbi:27579_t:CDS:2, partial [Gigaspora margarita]
MTKDKQSQNNNSTDTDTETESRNSSNSKLGRPQTGVWKFFTRGQSKVNNLEDIPTDEPFSKLTNWYDSTKIEAPKQLFIDEAITLAFIMCGIPFRIINNPFFINALNLLNPSYSIPSHEVLLGRLLDIEVAKVISKVDKILEHTNNLSIGLDNIIRHTFAEKMIHCANKIVGFFKKSYKAAAILNQKILLHQISSGEEIQENHSEIINSTILTIIHGFYNYCIEKFNKQFEEFNDLVYQLAYFLYSAFKGIGLNL